MKIKFLIGFLGIASCYVCLLLITANAPDVQAQEFSDEEIKQWWDDVYTDPSLRRSINQPGSLESFKADISINKADTYGYVRASDNLRWSESLAPDNRVYYDKTAGWYHNRQQSIEWMSTPADGKWDAGYNSSWRYQIVEEEQSCSALPTTFADFEWKDKAQRENGITGGWQIYDENSYLVFGDWNSDTSLLAAAHEGSTTIISENLTELLNKKICFVVYTVAYFPGMGGGNQFSIEAEINRHEIDNEAENSSQTPTSSTNAINLDSLVFSYNGFTIAHEGDPDEHANVSLDLPESAYIDTGVLITEEDLEKARQPENDQNDADDTSEPITSEPITNKPEDKPSEEKEEKSDERETSSTAASTDSSNDSQNSSWLIWLVGIITVLATLESFAFLWIRFKKNKTQQKP